MPYSKLELRVRRIERELSKAQTSLALAQVAYREARDIRERLEGRLLLAKVELEEERESLAEV